MLPASLKRDVDLALVGLTFLVAGSTLLSLLSRIVCPYGCMYAMPSVSAIAFQALVGTLVGVGVAFVIVGSVRAFFDRLVARSLRK